MWLGRLLTLVSIGQHLLHLRWNCEGKLKQVLNYFVKVHPTQEAGELKTTWAPTRNMMRKSASKQPKLKSNVYVLNSYANDHFSFSTLDSLTDRLICVSLLKCFLVFGVWIWSQSKNIIWFNVTLQRKGSNKTVIESRVFLSAVHLRG